MSRAEERAQAYENGLDYYHYTGDNPSVAYKAGYEQAEKDLALTPDDIKTIVQIADSMLTGTAWDVVDWPDEQKYYEEVLKRFKEAKDGKKEHTD